MEAKNLICFGCKSWLRDAMGCVAFPLGIPEEITSGKNKHEKPLKGQGNALVFEKN